MQYRLASSDGDGTYTIDSASTLYMDTGFGSDSIGDAEFITRGPLAGHMVIAQYDGANSLMYFRVGRDGLPVGGTSPTLSVLAGGKSCVWGVSQDPVTGNIFAVIYDDDIATPVLYQTAAVA